MRGVVKDDEIRLMGERMAVLENALKDCKEAVANNRNETHKITSKVIQLEFGWRNTDKKIDNLSKMITDFDKSFSESINGLSTKMVVDEEVMKDREKQTKKKAAIAGSVLAAIIGLVTNIDKIKPIIIAIWQ